MRILVTGGAGYIGSAVVHRLLETGCEVRVVDLLVEGGNALITACKYPDFEIVTRDLRDERVAADVVAGCDAIIHLAAIVGSPTCDLMPDVARSTNVGATETLLAARSPEQRLVLASTGSVYGAVPSGYCDESTIPSPTTLYGWTKLEAEQKASRMANSFIMRLATVFGISRKQRWDLLVNQLTLEAVTKGKIDLYQPHARRSFIHIDDLSKILCSAVLEWKPQAAGIINLGDSKLNLTKAEVARAICDETGADLTLDARGEDLDKRDYVMSFSKITDLGVHCSKPLSTGIAELAKAAKLARRT